MKQFTFLSLVLLALNLRAEYPLYTVDTILPQVGQQGTTATVWIKGNRLQTAEEVLFYKPGIECIAIRPLDKIHHVISGAPVPIEEGKAIELDFKISPDAELGEYFLRLRTQEKVSEMLSFWVTPFKVVHELSPYRDNDKQRNNTPETAQKIELNTTVSGMYTSDDYANDIDLYRIYLDKGQRVSVQLLNARLGTHHYGGLTDMHIEVTSPSGKQVARNSRTALFGHDPFLTFYAPDTGDHLIEVRQQMDMEASNLHYALHVADFPRPVLSYPLGGQSGVNSRIHVLYADGSTSSFEKKLPPVPGHFEDALVNIDELTTFDGTIPSPTQFKLADFPNIYEAPGHNSTDNPQVVDQALPLALNGIIKKEGEKDWFKFTANKGERYRVRAYSRTMGSPLDPIIRIRPAEGNPSKKNYEQDDSLWEGHDWEGHHYRHQVKDRLDPIFMFEPDTDGEYLISIEDVRREHGSDYIYRVEFQPHEESLFTYLPPYPSQAPIVRDIINIHRGSTFSHPIAIQKGFGSRYSGMVRLEAKGLPNTIKFDAPVFPANQPSIIATFSTPKDTPLGTALVELIPYAADGNIRLKGALAQTHGVNDQRGGFAPIYNKTRKLGIGILEEAPFDVRIEQPSIGLAKGAELGLKVIVERKEGFEGAVYLEMDWLPSGVTKQPPLIIPERETVGYYTISATSKSTSGKYKLTITARENKGGNSRGGVGYHYIASPFITVEIMDPYLSIELVRTALERGKSGSLVGKIKHLRPFSGKATATLLRLPNGVQLTSAPPILPGADTVTFPLKIAPDTITGQYKEISCDVAIQDGDQEIHQQTGNGVIRIDRQRK